MNLSTTQIKDTYGNLVTIGSVAGTPTTGTLQNGAGSDLTSITLNGAAVFNEGGGDFDFRVEGDTDANLLFVDASTDSVGIGTSSPTSLLTVNGVASFGAGAVGTPSIARSNDLNTGLYFPAADTIAISTAGAEAMRVNSTGVVLVGASSFTRNQSSGNGTLFVDDSIMSVDGDIKKYFSRGTAGATTGTVVWKFKLRATGGVGVALVKLSFSARYASNTTTDSGMAVYYFQLHETTGGVITQNGLSAIYEYGLTYATDFAFADLTGGECTVTYTNTAAATQATDSTIEILSPIGFFYLDSVTYT